MGGQMGGKREVWISGWMGGCVEGQMDRWVGGDGCLVDSQINGQKTDRQLDRQTSWFIYLSAVKQLI